jgi:serine/tyrosine/threonine adenylyltransferase
MRFGFEHTYRGLPSPLHAPVNPTPVADPHLVVLNAPLAEELGLEPRLLQEEAAALLSGNRLPEDAAPIAMAYAGHQFGFFVPQLGDGRAILLGEVRGRDGLLRDVQLKGSGRTPFSRSGDGRAVLGPMLREYLISESMHALGVPTTRSLAVVTTGEPVLRDALLPGAVLTRVAASHIRVGTFQYARKDGTALRALLDYVIDRHYPEVRDAAVPELALLGQVAQRQAKLIADWMLIGFIHGVMNTDNMALSGETIDYGPCAFMDHYDPQTVFSSIDADGRYAYGNQPTIGAWNLARFAETLLPFIDTDQAAAVRLATAEIESFLERCKALRLEGMRRKLGLAASADGDAELVGGLLAVMQAAHADFTLTFRRLADVADNPEGESQLRELLSVSPDFDAWLKRWQARLAQDPQTPAERAARMRAISPAFIPRNHRVETALSAAERGDLAPFQRLLGVLQHPYDDQPENHEYARAPDPSERVLETFCGT